MRRAEQQPARARRWSTGFATVTVLGIVAVIALLSIGALHDALFGEQLAGSRLLHQRATALAAIGLNDAMARIGAMPAPGSLAYVLHPSPDSPERISVQVRHLATRALPAGFSNGAFQTHHFEIESTAYVARGIRMTQVQGVMRVLPVVATAATAATAMGSPS